jgi:hypothetical protein
VYLHPPLSRRDALDIGSPTKPAQHRDICRVQG